MIRPAPLLAAKLLPPAISTLHLPRPRLMERLRAGLDRRATVVLAGPGYGKSGLVARFLQEEEEDSVWYTLDPSDGDPTIFFRYLIQGMKEHAPEFGERSQGFWEALRFRPEEAERLADIFISDAQESLGGRLVMVLDGVQHLEGSEPCVRALRRLLAYLPGALHLILVGRSLPDVGLQALLAEGAVSLVEGEELLFTPEETRVLLGETLGLPARPETIERLHARTRGWVTALQLLRQTARLEEGAADLPEELFARTESEIFEYFSEEVFASESAEVRQFLLGACPPPAIDPEVCAEVLEGLDARAILAGLARRHMFISPLESRGAYYAFDPLFHDYLRRKLRAERGAEGTRSLDQRYARAFARRGDFARALMHALAAEDARTAADLLQRHGEALLRAGMLAAVRSAAQFLGSRGVRPAIVGALLGEACRLAGDHAAAVGHFEAALAARADGEAEITGHARASALQGLAYSLLKVGDVARASETAGKALAEAGEADPALRARVLNTLAIVRYRQDRAAEARSLWQDALARARQAGDDHLILMIAHNLGLPHAVAGDFRRASECFGILTSPENSRLGPEEGAAYLNLARIETLRGELGRAASHLSDAREIAQKWQLKGLLADALEEEGNLCRERGDLEAARERYARARALLMELGRLDLLDSLAEEEAILAARRGDHAEAESVAAGAVERRRAAGDPEGVASGLLALGEVRVRAAASGGEIGTPPRAAEALEKSAAFFASRGRAYQECVARLWLALARHLQADRRRAAAEAREALRIAARHDYRAAVLRVAALDTAFRDLIASLPDAPPYLGRASAAVAADGMAPGAASPAGLSPAAAAHLAAFRRPGTLSSDVAGADLTVRLLGPIEVYRDEQRKIPAQAWKIRRALQVFCYLAVARDHRATRDRLADALWGAARPSVIERNFHPTISFLRRALNHWHNVPKNFILCERGAYLLNPAYGYDIDVEAFEERIRAARRRTARGDVAGALEEYAAALALYRGPLMEEEYDDWIEAPRAHLEELHAAALGEAGDLHARTGGAEEAAACFRLLAERDPIDERASASLMRALGSLKSRAGVEKEFARLERALDEELSEAPLPETRRVYQEALAAAAAPVPGGSAVPASPPAAIGGRRPGRRAARRGTAIRGI
jgi:ATP/maltotriose-dependent transcriptional regulator MalT/DNA-binding SARP family transcriptional activator